MKPTTEKDSNALLLPTPQQVQKFEMLSPMLDSAYEEMSELSKKKQDGVLNPLKVRLINRLLVDIKNVLVLEPTTDYLELLEEELLPQNSDVVLILGQYRAAMVQFHSKHYHYATGWSTRG